MITVSAHRRRRGLAVAAAAAALATALGGVAAAYWSTSDSGNPAAAAADSLPAGGTPTATAAGGGVISLGFTRAISTGGRDVTSYLVRRYGAPAGGAPAATFSCAWPASTTLSCIDTSAPPTTWYYTDTPAAGNWLGAESARSTAVNSDTTAPTVSVTSITPAPNGNGYNNASPVVVSLAATDDAGGSGVASITYWVDAGAHTTVNAATATVSVSGDGTHAVSFLAADNAGNSSSTSTQAIRIDTVAPTAATIGSYPNPVNLANRAALAVSGSAEANATVTLTIADAGSAHSVTRSTTADGGGAWSATGLDVTALNDGTVTFRVTATDAAGNTSTAASVTCTKDTVAPAVSAVAVGPSTNTTTGAIAQGGTYYVYANAADTAPGTLATLTANAAALSAGQSAVVLSSTGGPFTAGGVTYAYRSAAMTAGSPLAQGSYSVTATAHDAAGNTGTATGSVFVDDTAPTASAAIGPAANASAGAIRQGGTYYVYANAAATTPATITGVTASVANLTTGQTALALSAAGGPFSAGGVSYAYRSAVQTANATLAPGTKTFTVTATDSVTNSSGATAGSVSVDNTPPAPSTVVMGNHAGGTAGKPETGDTITFTYSEQMDPATLYTGWTVGGTPDLTTATVTFNDSTGGNGTNKNNDSFTVTAPAGTTLGTVTDLEGHLVPTQLGAYAFTATLHYAVIGGQSVVTVTLTALNSGGTSSVGTASTSTTYTWNPTGAPTDLATNPLTGAATGTALPF